jgi:membrane protein implicated in regulation of membrane protease activity
MLAEVLDLGIDLDVWPWVWLVVGTFFAVIELTVLAGSFVLLPFAVSAFAASLLGFYDASIEVQWFVFIVGGGALWIVFYRYAQRFAGNNEIAPGVGAERLVGLAAIVTTTIDPDDTERKGRVSVDGEVWGALSDDGVLHEGDKVQVTDMAGTRVRVIAHDPNDTGSTTEDQ